MTGMLIVSVYLVATATAAFILAMIGELDVFEKPAVAIKRVLLPNPGRKKGDYRDGRANCGLPYG